MSSTTIAQVLSYPDGTPVQDIQVKVTKVWPARTIPSGKRVQDLGLRDGSGAECSISVWEHDDLGMYENKEVVIKSGPKGGLKVVYDDYKKKNKLSASGTSTFQVVAGAPSAPSSNTQEGAAQGAASTPQGQVPIVVRGEKVGMAINNACNFMVETGALFNEEDLWKLASSIIRVSCRIEGGDVWKPAPDAKDGNAPF